MQTPLSVLLKEKGNKTYHISAQATAYECTLKMNEHGIGALLVMEGEKLSGIVSERDLIRKLLGQQGNPSTVKVMDIMTKEPVTVPPTMTVGEAMRLVTERRFRHLPVVEEGKLIGIISIGDLTKWVMLSQEHEIADLTGYIHGK